MSITSANLPPTSGVRTWINNSRPLPDWVQKHLTGAIETNGTFVVRTPLGATRVHRQSAVIEHLGLAYTCEAIEVGDLLDRLSAESASTGIPVGPGKRLDRSGAEPAGHRKRRRAAHAAPLGTMPSIEWVHIERLSVDTSYQRSIDNEASRRLIASIAAHFDWRLCAPLVVSRRPTGELIVIDGQHRTTAAKRRADIPQLPCCIFNYEGPEEEARMFIAANRARKPMNRLDDFHAALAARDEDALEIHLIVSDAGLKVARNTAARSWQPGDIAFTAAVATSIRRQGPAIVSAALTNMAEAFPTERLTHGGSIFLGLVKVLGQPPEHFDPDQMLEVLKQRTAEQWGQAVTGLKGSQARAMIIKDDMLEAYAKSALKPVREGS